jgi:diguanylate cyclase (GGDEF)-like protein/PAS domain S-box-containing protein
MFFKLSDILDISAKNFGIKKAEIRLRNDLNIEEQGFEMQGILSKRLNGSHFRSAVKASEEKIGFAQDSLFSTSIAIIHCSADWRIIRASKGLLDLLCVDGDHLSGEVVQDLLPFPIDCEPALRPLATSEAGYVRYEKKDGSILWLDVKFSPFDDGYLIQVCDVTRLVEQNHELAYTESIWRHAIEASGHGVWEYNFVTGHRFHSEAWKRMRGFDVNETIVNDQEEWEARLHPDDRERLHRHTDAHNTGEISQFSEEYRERRTDGKWVWILARGRHVQKGANGEVQRLIGTDIDITKIKEKEERRAREIEQAHTMHVKELAEAHQATEAARELAHLISRKDPLTGLPNRRVFMEELERLSSSRRKAKAGFAVLLIDLDQFKPINDAHGHAVGDFVIRKVAHRLEKVSFAGATVARLGGDEFGVILPLAAHKNCADFACAQARNLLSALEPPIVHDDLELSLGASIGISVCPDHGSDFDTLFRMAEIAMYNVKQNGRGSWLVCSQDIGKEAEAKARIAADVRKAVIEDRIEPYFQPVIDLNSGRVASFEVLARWNHPQFGAVSPERFLPIIEQSGLMSQFSASMIAKACRIAGDWPDDISIAVNISADEICDPRLPRRVHTILRDCKFPPNRFSIEITEQALVKDFASAKAVVSELRMSGIKILLDDFGTGYSGLGYLRELEFDCLKIDRSFIVSLLRQQESLKIVDAILALARNLNIRTVAEGIEDMETSENIRRLGCTMGQGYYFAKPMMGEDAHAFLRSWWKDGQIVD